MEQCIKEVKYFVNENERTVVAKIFVDDEAVLRDVQGLLFKSSKRSVNLDIVGATSKMLVEETYVGKAHCMEEDVFNLETGKKLALLRAIKQLLKDKKRVSSAYLEYIKEQAERASGYESYLEKSINALEEKIEKCINS